MNTPLFRLAPSRPQAFLALVAGLLSLMLCSCTPKPRTPRLVTIELNPNDGITQYRFEVAVLLANSYSLDRINKETVSLPGFFEQKLNKLPPAERLTNYLHEPGQTAGVKIQLKESQAIPGNTLIILANIAMTVPDKDSDPRRVVLPLDPTAWPLKTREVTVQLGLDHPSIMPAPTRR
jgi:hypothetical protein